MTLVAKLDTRRLDAIIAQEPVRSAEIIKKAALQVEAVAKPLAPIDTGALRNSIQAEQMGPHTWWVQDGVEYGIYQELGTRKMAAHPFMVPAVERVRPFFEKLFAELVK